MRKYWPAVMAHTNLILQATGWLDGGLVASFEKFMLDVEIIERFTTICQEQAVNEETFLQR
jgi:trimethylamine--corrinoid protein Co-methyltransferase